MRHGPRGARWQRGTLERAAWRHALPAACVDELTATVRILERNPLDSFLLHPDDYPLDATRTFIAGRQADARQRCGFAVLDRLPIAALSRDQAKQLYWLLSMMIARPGRPGLQGHHAI
ncbi:MAG: hypothetical protein WDO24_21300 [Pseudomonadota bacterium]